MFEGNTYEAVLERMLARVSDKLDKREGAVIYDTHSPTALEFAFLYTELERILQEAYGDTASREYLILRCKERGIAPFPATNAVLKGEFIPEDIDLTGKRFNIGDINYTAVQQIAGGTYQMQCETAGEIGNQFLGTMIPIDYIAGLETAELTQVLIPGEDEEDTEDLRKRYFASYDKKAFSGNVQDYLVKTNAVPGVGSTKVERIWNGDIRPADMIPSQAVKAWYDTLRPGISGEPAAWLDAVFHAAEQKKLTTGGTVLLTILDSGFSPASSVLVKAVQDTIDPEGSEGEGMGLAPIGHAVSVQSAQGVPVSVKTNITFDTGYDWSDLSGAINAAVSGYLLELRKAWADSGNLIVRISQIEACLLSVPGVLDVGNTTINHSKENLILDAYQVPVLEGISA